MKYVLYFALGVAVAALVAVYFIAIQPNASGGVSDISSSRFFTFLSGTTTTATSTDTTDGSGKLIIESARKITLVLSRGSDGTANTGSSRFSVEVATSSETGALWHDFNKLVQNVATGSPATLAHTLQYVTLTGTSTTVVSLDLRYDAFYLLRCIADEVTDGMHTCAARIEY